ncbi:polyketide synthase docking domain-containing protein, partial [Streptomyces chartreusis]
MNAANNELVEALRASLKETERLQRENDRMVERAREP